MGQTSSNLLKKAFATLQHAFLSISIALYDIYMYILYTPEACAEIKILTEIDSFRMRK